jgi:hypothetical protein
MESVRISHLARKVCDLNCMMYELQHTSGDGKKRATHATDRLHALSKSDAKPPARAKESPKTNEAKPVKARSVSRPAQPKAQSRFV